jgi:hypothetical protein
VATGSCRFSAHRLWNYPAPSAPRSGPLAATLFGGLRPGSLRVHAPCKNDGHGSRLGFPGRRQPRGPAPFVNVARGLQVLLPAGRRDPAAASQMLPASEGTPFSRLAISVIGRRSAVGAGGA